MRCAPGEPAVLTVGSLQAGTKSNVIPDHAVLELNVRTYDDRPAPTVLAPIERIVTAECEASGSPGRPSSSCSTASRSPTTTPRSPRGSRPPSPTHFGDRAGRCRMQTASEDFSDIPTALGVPYTYWGIGGIDPDTYRAAASRAGSPRTSRSTTPPTFAPVIQPTLDTGTAALVVAALAWLAGADGTASR